jgi:fructose 1,6-bisphosphate aldolase/phosphatase
MTHFKGVDNEEIHKLAWDTFLACTKKAKELKLYGAGQDLLKDAFSGNVKGMGPGVADGVRGAWQRPPSSSRADKTEPSAFNYLLYRVFADPATRQAGHRPQMTGGFSSSLRRLRGQIRCPWSPRRTLSSSSP